MSSDGSATNRLCGLGLGPASVRRGEKRVPGAVCSSGSSAPPDVQHSRGAAAEVSGEEASRNRVLQRALGDRICIL